MNADFLLIGDTAKELYQKYASKLPIIDYHNHLSLTDLKADTRFTDIYELWIKPDPYKHRAMRMCGVPEQFITGDSDFEAKFKAWCTIFPDLLGNPLYHWSLAELQTVFGIAEIPSAENADELYRALNRHLSENKLTPKVLLDKFNVELACPCASLSDELDFFEGNQRLAPSLRGDNIVAPSAEFVKKLSAITKIPVNSIEDYKAAVSKRLDDFEKVGCRYTDHALDNGFTFFEDDGKNSQRFDMLLNGTLSANDMDRLASCLLVFLGAEYAKRNLTMQLHIGARRYTSSRLRSLAGAAGGYAAIGNSVDVKSLTSFLDALEQTEYGLPKTVLFTLNPADNALISALSGSYSKDGARGLITQGPAWWWCDHKPGITDMLENTSVFSLLSNFVGMTTDSRSFLSFVRHDYFRRVLCSWIAKKTSDGDLPNDEAILGRLIQKLCFKNAKETVKE